jgi:hypothetical protein
VVLHAGTLVIGLPAQQVVVAPAGTAPGISGAAATTVSQNSLILVDPVHAGFVLQSLVALTWMATVLC